MSDQCLIYRGTDLVVDDDIVLTSLNTGSLLVGGISVRPLLVTRFTDLLNINSAASVPLTMIIAGEFNNMPAQISKTSNVVLTVGAGGAGTYMCYLVCNVNPSASSVQIQVLQNAGVISVGNISPADSGTNISFIVTLAVGDTLNFNSIRVGGNATAKSLLGNSSSLYITKIA